MGAMSAFVAVAKDPATLDDTDTAIAAPAPADNIFKYLQLFYPTQNLAKGLSD